MIHCDGRYRTPVNRRHGAADVVRGKDHMYVRSDLRPSVSSAWLGVHRANAHTDEAKYIAPPASNNNILIIPQLYTSLKKNQ